MCGQPRGIETRVELSGIACDVGSVLTDGQIVVDINGTSSARLVKWRWCTPINDEVSSDPSTFEKLLLMRKLREEEALTKPHREHL